MPRTSSIAAVGLLLAALLAGCLGGTDRPGTRVYTKQLDTGNVTVWVDQAGQTYNVSITVQDRLGDPNLSVERQRRIVRLAVQRFCPSVASMLYNSSSSSETPSTIDFRSGYRKTTPGGTVLAQNATLPKTVLHDYTVRNAVLTLRAGESWVGTCRINSFSDLDYTVERPG